VVLVSEPSPRLPVGPTTRVFVDALAVIRPVRAVAERTAESVAEPVMERRVGSKCRRVRAVAVRGWRRR
jgi:hypothetical protein